MSNDKKLAITLLGCFMVAVAITVIVIGVIFIVVTQVSSTSNKTVTTTRTHSVSTTTALKPTLANQQKQSLGLSVSPALTSVPEPPTEPPATSTPVLIDMNHKLIHVVKGNRFDNGIILYVLIDPININDPKFLTDIQVLVDLYVREYGSKTSIEFHDSQESLNISYMLYGSMTLGRPTNKRENDLMAIHHIASFTGDLEINTYLNTIDYFPQADFGKSFEYNPK